jgi:hypothetical protein
MNESTIYLKPNKRMKFARSFGHVTPGIILVLSGLEGLASAGREHLWLALLSIAAGAAVVIAFIREMRHTRSDAPHGINWLDVFAGIVLFVEAAHRYSPEKGFQPAHGYAFAGLLTIALGIFHARLAALARITCTKEGVFARTAPFRSVKVAWEDIASPQITDSVITLNTKSGDSPKIDLRTVENKNEVIEFFNKQWERYAA